MSSSTSVREFSTQALGPTISPTSPCLFLELLPLEIRQTIYRYLLAPPYVRRELDMKSSEYDARRGSILRGPDYTYHLHPSILMANKQIREETLDVLERESQFVGIVLERPEGYRNWQVALRSNINVLATGARAWAFPNVGMDIDFRVDSSHVSSERENRMVCVIPVEDLPAACAELQYQIRTYTRNEQTVDILLRGYDQVPTSKQARWLEPLRQIRGATSVNGFGPGWPSLNDVVSDMCGQDFSANETMDLVGTFLNEGDEVTNQGKPELAISRYKAALNAIHGNIFDQDEENQPLVGGRFNGFPAGSARDYTFVQLHRLIADAYLRLGHPRLARVYVERIYGPLHSYDHRHNKEKFPLRIPQDHNPEVYAEVLVVASKISMLHSQFGEAYVELCEAKDLDPASENVERQMKELDAVSEKRFHGCARNRAGRKKNLKAKYHGSVAQTPPPQKTKNPNVFTLAASLEVAIKRAAKGDEASENINLQIARYKYEAAYTKVQATINSDQFDWPFSSGSCHRASWALTMELLPKLTETCLELGELDSVHRWAGKIISHSPVSHYTHVEPRSHFQDWRCYVPRRIVNLAFYCKAVAYLWEGGPDARGLAIENFERALVCDGGCHASYYQLQTLKEMKEAEEASLDEWGKMLRLDWD